MAQLKKLALSKKQAKLELKASVNCITYDKLYDDLATRVRIFLALEHLRRAI